MISLCYCISGHISSLENRTALLNPNLVSCQYSCGGKGSRIHLVRQLPSAAEAAGGAFPNKKCNTAHCSGNPGAGRTEMRINHVLNSKYNLSTLSKYTEVDCKRHTPLPNNGSVLVIKAKQELLFP